MAVTRNELVNAPSPLIDAAEKELDTFLRKNWRAGTMLIWRSEALNKLTSAEIQILIKRYSSFNMWHDQGKPRETDNALVIE